MKEKVKRKKEPTQESSMEIKNQENSEKIKDPLIIEGLTNISNTKESLNKSRYKLSFYHKEKTYNDITIRK